MSPLDGVGVLFHGAFGVPQGRRLALPLHVSSLPSYFTRCTLFFNMISQSTVYSLEMTQPAPTNLLPLSAI